MLNIEKFEDELINMGVINPKIMIGFSKDGKLQIVPIHQIELWRGANMNAVQEEWEKMRIAYQIRYARMYKKVKDNEFNTDNHGALLEMSYVLIEVFGLTDKQVKEVERNDGLTNADLESN